MGKTSDRIRSALDKKKSLVPGQNTAQGLHRSAHHYLFIAGTARRAW